jgi:hypothetical protein
MGIKGGSGIMKKPVKKRKGLLIAAVLLVFLINSPAMAAAILNSSLSLNPANVSTGQMMTLIMNVTNSGTDDAIAVTGQNPVFAGTGMTTYFIGPSPAAQLINAGSYGSITWVYMAAMAGCFSFSSSAAGTDNSNGLPVVSAATSSNGACIQTPAALSCAISAIPDPVAVGDEITVVMTVSNAGQATAINVAHNLSVYGTALFSYITFPAIADIAGGASADFTWTFSAASAGNLCFSGYAQGSDGNSWMVVSSGGSSYCITVDLPTLTFTETPIPSFTDTPTVQATPTTTITTTPTGVTAGLLAGLNANYKYQRSSSAYCGAYTPDADKNRRGRSHFTFNAFN